MGDADKTEAGVSNAAAIFHGLGLHRSDERATLAFGVAAIDRHFPGGGLRLGALHEVLEAPQEEVLSTLAELFAAGLFARLCGPVLWCVLGRAPFAPGLAGVGLHPDRVLYSAARREADILPAMEEGLRHHGLAGVIGTVRRLGLTASRRLQLAAEESGGLALAIRRSGPDGAVEPSAAFTRWRIGAVPSPPPDVPGLLRARWRLELLHARGAAPRSWIVEAPDAQGRLTLPADLAHRPLAQAPWRAASG